MHKLFFATISLFIFMGIQLSAQTYRPDAIVGNWRINDKKANINIYEQNGKFFGKITGGDRDEKYDVNNRNPEKRKNLLKGTVILNNLVFSRPDSWKSGTIYDPDNGKTYNCMIEIKDKNNLEVTGYLGIPLFGKTQAWTRIKEKS